MDTNFLEMLKNENLVITILNLLAMIGADTAENEPDGEV